MKTGTLGPRGSFSEIAALKYDKNSELVFLKHIYEIFEKIKSNEIEQGVVPIENMIEGTVRETLDNLYEAHLMIKKEVIVPIHHCLASKSSEFSKIISHPQALAQCSGFLKEYKDKNFEIEETTSTSRAMEIASGNNDYAAIGSERAAELNNLEILEKEIENNKNNATSFIVVSRNSDVQRKEGVMYKTSMALHPSEDRPGLLFDILAVFKIQNINLTKIESRPTEKKLGEYIFYIDFDGHQQDKNINSAIEFLKTIVPTIKIFGSYETENDNQQ